MTRRHTHLAHEIARPGECPECDARLQAQLTWKPADWIALARIAGWTFVAVIIAAAFLM